MTMISFTLRLMDNQSICLLELYYFRSLFDCFIWFSVVRLSGHCFLFYYWSSVLVMVFYFPPMPSKANSIV